LADFFLQGGAFGQGRRCKEARPEVAESAHFLAEFEETLFWTDCTNTVLGAANSAEEDSVGRFGGGESFIC